MTLEVDMGERGPVGKRSDQRHGHRSKAELASIDKVPGAAIVEPPPASEDWHPVARQMYLSLAESGQSRFYEPSDWSVAYLLAESISLDLKPQFVGFVQTSRDTTEAEHAVIPLKGASLAAYLKALSNLLATEGDRRRASLELQRASVAADADEDASVTALDAYRAQLEG